MVKCIGRACALLVSISLFVDAFSVGSLRHETVKHSSSNALRMVATEPSLTSKYPTARGSEVDSRKIVVAGRQKLTAVRLSHVLFASEEMASNSLSQLSSASMSFDDLAKRISNCAETREAGGSIGWVSVHEENDTSANEHLDLILPPEARSVMLHLSTKVR